MNTERLLAAPVFDSKAKGEKPSLKEEIIGFFFSPGGMATLNALLGTYVNIYYTDVLKLGYAWSGMFLVLLPIISKIISIFVNIIFGRIIDKTKSRQGKARPWVLLSAPFCLVFSILLFLNLNLGELGNTIVIFIIYNLYFSFASNIYTMSHSLLVPLSSKNDQERNLISIISSIGQYFGIGVFSIGVFTMLLYPLVKKDTSLWLPIVAAFSLAAFICIIFEYYFTLERNKEEKTTSVMPLKEQLKSLFTDKYWVMIAVITALYAFAAQARTISLVYYCEWTLGTYESYRLSYALIQMVGGLPLWIGALVIHPILKKVSKQKAICIGLFIAAFGDALEFFFMKNIYVVVTGAVIRNIGLVPISYSFTALLADVMDHIAYVKGQRCDGAVISGDTIIKTIFYGLGTSVVNLAMWLNNYQAPDASLETQAAQSEAMQRGFGFVFSGIPAITALTGAVIFLFLDVEKKNEILKNARSAKGE